MSANNPFNTSNYDLGVGDVYGYDKDSATENILRDTYSTSIACYVCGNKPQYRLIAKQPEYNTAQVQNGVYVCKHCITSTPISPKQYGIKELD
jgi:hypothetical protein